MRLFNGCAQSGGAQDGAYQAGVLLSLWDKLEKGGVTHEQITDELKVWTGVSVGAINGSFMAQGKHPSELCDLWRRTRTHDVLSKFCFGILQGYWKGGMYGIGPLHELLKKNVDPKRITDRGAKFLAGAVSLKSGAYVCTEDYGDDFYLRILASASHPIAMVPVMMDDHLWTDGGVRNVTPLRCAVRAGADNILAIIASPEGLERWDDESPTILARSLREFAIIMNEAHRDDLKMTDMVNLLVELEHPTAEAEGWRLVDYRVVRPLRPLESEFLEFTEAQADKLIEQGIKDGQEKFDLMEV